MRECLLCKRDMKIAFFSEIFGVIKEYSVNIEFDVNGYEVD